MRSIVELIKKYSSTIFLDEDQNSLFILLNTGISKDKIDEFEKMRNIILPLDLRELLLFSNGLELFGLSILSLEDMEFFIEEKFLSFHNWANGDFDCISVNDKHSNGDIFFIRHSVDNCMIIASSLFKWIIQVINEIENKGALLHPFDYNNREEDGMYKELLKDLN